jgi:Glycosyl hydrolase 36 superfamily, catalytic domain
MLTQVLSTEGYRDGVGPVNGRLRPSVGPESLAIRDREGPHSRAARCFPRAGAWLLLLAALVVVPGLYLATTATAAGPPPLSRDSGRPDIRSPAGSGIFGRWHVDGFGLPAYRYELDPDRDPRTRQPELKGSTDAWQQLGNDHIVATAHTRGHVQLWSQDRSYQWVNLAEPSLGQNAGGYGYLRTSDGSVISTLYADRPAGASTRRDFGTGYFGRLTAVQGIAVRERVYAPFGDDPLLLHDVTIRNSSRHPLRASWFEYWGVNPRSVVNNRYIGLARPAYDSRRRTLSARQLPDAVDSRPLTVFAAALRGRVADWETDGGRFFRDGGRAKPTEVAAGRLSRTLAAEHPGGSPGRHLFAFRTPALVAPGGSVTLRYAYGLAHARRIPALVDRWRQARRPLARSERAWRAWLPRARLGAGRNWLSRELQWDAYMLRSGATYEEACGHHILSQGGYYQYEIGIQAAYRDPLQHILPLIYAYPELARETIRYSAAEQKRALGFLPYSLTEMCKPAEHGTSADLDLWLLLAAAEYGLGTRDLSFFDERLPWADGGAATLWRHLRQAHRNQESRRGPHGGYLTGTNGDWSDFSTPILGMTESILVTAQLAYVYPRLAELADARGDRRFAAALRADAGQLRAVLEHEWTGRGWYSRGYGARGQIGRGVIFGEPQPWALLAGVPGRRQARTLVANIRRFLTGVGAPPQTHGPARIGSSQSPARNDPDVQERTEPPLGIGDNNAVFVGGAWYAINGWLTWALGELDGVVPRAREYAFDELERNTLTAHARAYPQRWNGVISVDDVCSAHYASDPSRCGIGLFSGWNTQIMHQPSWGLFATLKLAGLDPVRDGYRIDPHLPMRSFSLRLPDVGIEYGRARARGYLRPHGHALLRITVSLPDRLRRGPVAAFVEGRRVAGRRAGAELRLSLRARRGRVVDWAVARP